MTVKIGNKKYRMAVRHVIEVRITDPCSGFVWGEGRSKCHSSDQFCVWTGIRQATTKALAEALCGRSRKADRRLFWDQALIWFGIKEKPAPKVVIPKMYHGILRATAEPLAEPEAYDPNVQVPPGYTGTEPIYTAPFDEGPAF